jgi:hypothetical protein
MQDHIINTNCESEVSISRYEPPAPAAQVWDRPSYLLPMPVITGVETIIAILVEIDNASYNTITIPAIAGNYIVDWGDSVVENYASGTSASHSYSFAAISQATETPQGYRQALISITPQAGSDLTSFASITTAHRIFYSALDIVASGPNLVFNNITSRKLLHVKLLCKVNGIFKGIVNANNITEGNTAIVAIELDFNSFSNRADLFQMFQACVELKYVSPFATTGITNFSNIFNNCWSIVDIPNINFNNATNLNSAFTNCYELQSIPTIALSSPCSISSSFNNCFSLAKINMSGQVTYSIPSQQFSQTHSLNEIPALDFSTITINGVVFGGVNLKRFLPTGMTRTFTIGDGTVSAAYPNSLGRQELVEVFNNLGTANSGATLTIKGSVGVGDLTNNDKLIATNKGWTLILV